MPHRAVNEINLQKVWFVIALSSVAQFASAAVPPPSAGSQIQQIPAAPAPDKPAPQLEIKQHSAPGTQQGDGTAVTVNALHVTNARAFPESVLVAAAEFKPGTSYTLAGLKALAVRIASYYHSHGYFLAQAVVPAQDVAGGSVKIAVIEGHYGKVLLQNHSTLSDGVARDVIHGLDSGAAITIAPLESRLLQLSDLPGVSVKSTLVPGASVGASDLIVDVSPGQRVTGSIDADNAGNRYTGEERLGGTANLNDPFGRGDVATLRVLSSFDGLDYGRFSYQMQFGRADAGLAYTAMDYDLGKEFKRPRGAWHRHDRQRLRALSTVALSRRQPLLAGRFRFEKVPGRPGCRRASFAHR